MLAVLSGGIEPEPKRRQAALSDRNRGESVMRIALSPSAPAAWRLPGQQGRRQRHDDRPLSTRTSPKMPPADVGNTAENIAGDYRQRRRADRRQDPEQGRRRRRQRRHAQRPANATTNTQLDVGGVARRAANGRAVGEWRSLVAHLLWEQRVAGSNPVSPTNPGRRPASWRRSISRIFKNDGIGPFS